MVTRRRKKKKTSKPKAKKCTCGSCEYPNPHLRGYLLMALGVLFTPISSGFFPEFEWAAKGWPILLILFGAVLVARAVICQRK